MKTSNLKTLLCKNKMHVESNMMYIPCITYRAKFKQFPYFNPPHDPQLVSLTHNNHNVTVPLMSDAHWHGGRPPALSQEKHNHYWQQGARHSIHSVVKMMTKECYNKLFLLWVCQNNRAVIRPQHSPYIPENVISAVIKLYVLRTQSSFRGGY